MVSYTADVVEWDLSKCIDSLVSQWVAEDLRVSDSLVCPEGHEATLKACRSLNWREWPRYVERTFLSFSNRAKGE